MGDLEAHATLAEDESYVACVALVKEKEYSGCKEVHGHFPEINAYGPGLSAWFEVYKAASGALRGRSSKAFMAVVNAFLAEWAGLEKGSYFQGFSYQPETVSFAVDAEVWGGLDEGFRRDFQAARQMFGKMKTCASLAKVLTLMTVNLEREKQIWLRDNRTAGTDFVQGAPFEGSLEKGGYAPPTDWKSILDAERAREKTEAKEPEKDQQRAVRARAAGPSQPPAYDCNKCGRSFLRPCGLSSHTRSCLQTVDRKRKTASTPRKTEPLLRWASSKYSEWVPRKAGSHASNEINLSKDAPNGSASKMRLRTTSGSKEVADEGAKKTTQSLPSTEKDVKKRVEGDPIRSEAVTDVAAMITEGVDGILRDAARQAREETTRGVEEFESD